MIVYWEEVAGEVHGKYHVTKHQRSLHSIATAPLGVAFLLCLSSQYLLLGKFQLEAGNNSAMAMRYAKAT
jgi:hypothetical protein